MKSNIIPKQIAADFPVSTSTFPQTRYQGSKLKLVEWIVSAVGDLNFDTVLDAFGGTGAVSYAFKQRGKKVTYNDLLKFNYWIGVALIENDDVVLTDLDIEYLLDRRQGIVYPSFIADTFHDIYFTDEEHKWLDVVATNINTLSDQGEEKYKKALAFFALFQSAIIKRPYNLFHRKNLYIRTSDVQRSFGNKTTWEKPFEEYFRKFAKEASQAVFSNNRHNSSSNCDALSVPGTYDLVYVDTPYVSSKGVGVDYLDFYHFLEGLTDYQNWGKRVNYHTKHRKLNHKKSVWSDKTKIIGAFDQLFARYSDSTIVVSYRSPGIPTVEELMRLLSKYKKKVREVSRRDYQYVLSNGKTEELLLVAS